MSTSRAPEQRSATDPLAGGGRRAGRERALALLYEAEQKGIGPLEVTRELPVAPQRYGLEILTALVANAATVDSLIGRYCVGWRLERVPMVDRALLRIAVTELIARPEIPAAVVIDEAVELAKVYSTALSGSYLNGVLGAVARETRPAGELSSPARCPAEVPSGP